MVVTLEAEKSMRLLVREIVPVMVRGIPDFMRFPQLEDGAYRKQLLQRKNTKVQWVHLLPGFRSNSIGFFVTKICFQFSNIFDNFPFFSKKFPSKRIPPIFTIRIPRHERRMGSKSLPWPWEFA